jgi:DNA (cytosine-5)-methyltransferase 1
MYSKIYNAAKFGVPSRRKRYFCGDFPSPVETVNNNEEIVHLRHVLQYLGEPNEKYNSTIPDPNYEFSLPGHRVTDHHYIQKLANYQWETAKRLKQDKGYMGKMSFPENLDRPARTVMATMTFGARESMIFRNGSNGYRAPTIREVASLMSFPLDYKFFGKSIGIKYRLVGNAVPPKLAFAFAKAIKNEEGLLLTTGYSPLNHIGDKELIDFNGRKIPVPKEKPKHKNSRFKYHIPYLIIDTFRVELTNYHSDFLNHNYKWDIEIHKSQGPRARIYHPIITRDAFTNAEVEKIKKFLLFVNKKIVSFNEFQEIYCKTTLKRKSLGLIGPFELLDLVKEFITTSCVSSDINLDVKLDNEFSYLPKKIAMGYFVLTTICEEMGRISHEC